MGEGPSRTVRCAAKIGRARTLRSEVLVSVTDHPQPSVVAQFCLLSIPQSTVDNRPAGKAAETLARLQITDRRFSATAFSLGP